MFTIELDYKKPLRNYQDKTEIYLNFNNYIYKFKNKLFNQSQIPLLCDKLYILWQYNPEKIQCVLKHDQNIQQNYIHYIQHSYRNKQYGLLLYFFNNSHLYLKDLNYIIRIMNDYHIYILKTYADVPYVQLFHGNTKDLESRNVKIRNYAELIDLIVNMCIYNQTYNQYHHNIKCTMDNIFSYTDPTIFYDMFNETQSCKKIVDNSINRFNCFQIWILSKILLKQNNPLLHLKKMLFYIIPLMENKHNYLDNYKNLKQHILQVQNQSKMLMT